MGVFPASPAALLGPNASVFATGILNRFDPFVLWGTVLIGIGVAVIGAGVSGLAAAIALLLPGLAHSFAIASLVTGVVLLLALSGGYDRDQACAELAKNDGIIASFSRALLDDLRAGQSDAEFDAVLDEAITAIHAASVDKVPA